MIQFAHDWTFPAPAANRSQGNLLSAVQPDGITERRSLAAAKLIQHYPEGRNLWRSGWKTAIQIGEIDSAARSIVHLSDLVEDWSERRAAAAGVALTIGGQQIARLVFGGLMDTSIAREDNHLLRLALIQHHLESAYEVRQDLLRY